MSQSNHKCLSKGKNEGHVIVEGSGDLRVIEKLEDARLPAFKVGDGTMNQGKQMDYSS